MRYAFLVILYSLLFGIMPSFVASATSENVADPTPIVAELYGNPSAFDGRVITIYGLVTDSARSSGYFLLQDVSEHPIRITVGQPVPAKGDQIQVTGTVHVRRGNIWIEARKIIHVQVVHGGGCC